MAESLLPLDTVMTRTGIKRTKIYALIGLGTFPAPVKIGTASRWQETKVEQWIAEQIAASDSNAA